MREREQKKQKDQYYIHSPRATIFPPYASVLVPSYPRAPAYICVFEYVCVYVRMCARARSQYNERILFQQKGTSRWYTQSTPIHHHRRASSSAFPRPFPALIANRTLVCFICLYTKPNRIIITYARALHYLLLLCAYFSEHSYSIIKYYCYYYDYIITLSAVLNIKKKRARPPSPAIFKRTFARKRGLRLARAKRMFDQKENAFAPARLSTTTYYEKPTRMSIARRSGVFTI